MDKPKLRRQLRRHRNGIRGLTRHLSTRRLSDKLQTLSAIRHARRIGCYLAFDGEPDLNAWMIEHIDRIWLPVIDSRERLHFRPAPPTFQTRGTLHPNRYGIPEPSTLPIINVAGIDALLMPLVGFDEDGNRLGMGAGFYDRTLAALGPRRPTLIGIAFEGQRVDHLPADPWDIPLDYVVTERKIHDCRHRRLTTPST